MQCQLDTACGLGAYRSALPFEDALIAAIAQSAGMCIVPRNLWHFEPLTTACVKRGTVPGEHVSARFWIRIVT